MPEIKVFRATDGRITIRWPKGQLPDKATLKAICEAIKKERSAACANTRQSLKVSAY